MHRQVGDLVIGEDGLARRGILIRHLVMPGMLDEIRAILEWIAAELGTNTDINLMDQYRPAGKVGGTDYVPRIAGAALFFSGGLEAANTESDPSPSGRGRRDSQ